MSDGCDGWSEVKPLGEPVAIHVDYGNAFVNAMHGIQKHAFECTMRLEQFNKEFLDEVTGCRPAFDFFYKSNVRRMTYPVTVKQAKARHKGNRGNGKRRYEYVVVQCVMHDVRIKHETV